MKKSAILHVLNGMRESFETVCLGKKYNENLNEICNLFDEINAKFPPKLLNLNHKLIDLIEANYCELSDFYYVEGFKLGLRVGIECLQENNVD